MAFPYRLEKLLSLREQQQAAAAQKLAAKQRQLAEHMQKLQELRRSYAECLERCASVGEGLTGAELELLGQRSRHLLAVIKETQLVCEKLRTEVDNQRRQLEQALQARRSQERHRQKAKDKWNGAEKKKEQRRQDELFGFRGRKTESGANDE